MDNRKTNKNSFRKLIEKACKGTTVSPREVHQEIFNCGYKNFMELGLTLEELKTIVSDIAESKAVRGIPDSIEDTYVEDEANN